MRKHRGDSKLKTLPEDLQADIIAQMKQGTIDKVIAWLGSEWDIATSQGALSEFFSWWHMRQRMKEAEQSAQHHQEWLQQIAPDMSAEDVMKAGNLVFMAKASSSGDSGVFEAMAKLFLRAQKDKANAQFTREKISLEERRISVLEAKAAKLDEAKSLDAEKLSPAQYKERMQQILA